jgi:hypothetical protein
VARRVSIEDGLTPNIFCLLAGFFARKVNLHQVTLHMGEARAFSRAITRVST